MSLSSEHRSAIRSWVEENLESYVDNAPDLDDARDDMEADFQLACGLDDLGMDDLVEAIDLLEDIFYNQ